MDQAQLWTRFQKYFVSGKGISIDVSRMRFGDSHFAALEEATAKAFEEMAQLEKGAIANADEDRMVGHYWLRDSTLAPSSELKAAIDGCRTQIKEFAARVHSGEIKPPTRTKFTNVLVIGIGGSALGPQLVADALGSADDKMKLYFLDNTDPDGMNRVFTHLGANLAETLTIVISKSGGTVETQNGLMEAIGAYDRAGLTFSMHGAVITQPGSALDKRAEERKWIARFPLWDWVGGRTSLFSSVGLLPAALQGVDIEAFVDGAREMDVQTRTADATKNPAMLLASMWHYAGGGKGTKDMVVLPYKDRLVLFSKYLQQLVMESLGKEKDRDGKTVHQGLAVYGNKGSTDQHAYVQQLRDGIPNFFATFIEVLHDGERAGRLIEVKPQVTSGDYLNGFLQGTRRALFENGRDSITITLEKLNAHSLGGLIALFERAVGFYASLVNVNAYHQPGVEAGKKAAELVVASQQAILSYLSDHPGKPLTADEIAKGVGGETDAETAYHVLRHLASNPERNIEFSAAENPADVRFSLRG